MITYKNKDYYSLNDLTVLFEENDERIKELKSLFLKTYSKVSDFYVRTSYLQSKIYPGLRKKELTYIKYKKDTDGKREYYLFNIDDLTAEAKANYELVQENVAYFKQYLEKEDEPQMDIGEHCFKPYDCGFWKYCSRNLPTPNIFDVANCRKKIRLYKEGIVSFEQLEASDELNEKQRMQVEWELFDKPAYVDKEFVKEFLDGLSYPLYFLDFETFQSAIPLYDDSKPYEQLTFQYSLY